MRLLGPHQAAVLHPPCFNRTVAARRGEILRIPGKIRPIYLGAESKIPFIFDPQSSAGNDAKGPLFPTDERVEIVREEIANLADEETRRRIEVQAFDTLLMHFVASLGATVIIRGLRAVSDFEYEFQMAGMNNRLNSTVETVFLMASDRFQFISSRFVKEIGQLGGDVTPFVSPRVAAHLTRRFAEQRAAKPARAARAKAGHPHYEPDLTWFVRPVEP